MIPSFFFIWSFQKFTNAHTLCLGLVFRLLSDRLGILLHRGGRRLRHVAVHLARLFRREETKAISVLEDPSSTTAWTTVDGCLRLSGDGFCGPRHDGFPQLLQLRLRLIMLIRTFLWLIWACTFQRDVIFDSTSSAL